jgi:hypothetical protein
MHRHFSIITCDECGSRAVAVTGRVNRKAVVACSTCGRSLWTWDEFLEHIRTKLLALRLERPAESRRPVS